MQFTSDILAAKASTTTWSAQNGRDGVSIAHPAGAFRPDTPVLGRLDSLGRKAAHDNFQFTPDPESGVYVLLSRENVEVPEGSPARVAGSWDLQGGNFATLVVARPGALLRVWGYKRREVRYVVISPTGEMKTAPPAVVAVMLGATPEPVEEPPHLEADSPLAAALRAAGLA